MAEWERAGDRHSLDYLEEEEQTLGGCKWSLLETIAMR